MKKLKIRDTTENIRKTEAKRPIRKLAVAATLSLAGAFGCAPEISATNIPYDPYAADAGCEARKCETKTVTLREEGSRAGSNSVEVENVVVSVEKIDVENDTAKVVLVGCGEKAEHEGAGGDNVTLTVGGASYTVFFNSVYEDSAGPLARLTITPDCPVEEDDAGTGPVI